MIATELKDKLIDTIPKHWTFASLEDVVDILDNKRVPVNAKERLNRQGTIPYYGATGQVGWIDDYLFDEELILLGEDGAPFLDASKQKAYIIKGKSWVNNHAHVLRALNGIPNAYIKYYLDIVDYHSFVTGTTRFKLNQGAMRHIPVPVATPNEQKLIVSEIEKQFSRLDEAVAALKRIKANLKRYKASVLKAAVEGKFTEEWRKEHPDVEPASELLKRISDKRSTWMDNSVKSGNNEIKRLKSKFKKHQFEIPKNKVLPLTWQYASFLTASKIVVDCHNKTAPYIDKGVPLIRTTNIKDGCLMLEDTKYVSNETYTYWSRRCPPEPGDILFTREAPMGEAAIIPGGAKVCMGQRIMLIRVFHELVNIKYVLYAIMSPQFQDSFGQGAVGSGVKHLRVGDVESLVIPVPPLVEQNQIVNEVEQKLSVIEEVEHELTINLLRAERLRQSILKKAFSGRLVGLM